MKNLNLAYQKLSHNRSNVSSHYLISRNGIIFNFICPKYKAWHAGKSKWREHININDYSIGVELENRGHEYGYSNFTKRQYASLKKIINFLKKNFYILDQDIIYHSDISPNRKTDPGEKFQLYKIGVNRFGYMEKKIKRKYSLNQMLILYGFHIFYIKNYKKLCIEAVKRSLNYKKISPNISNKFINDFYNLLFL